MGRTARLRSRVDANHGQVRDALLAAGMKPVSLAPIGGGCPDFAVGFRGLTCLIEVKDGSKPPSARQLTGAEEDFRASWPGHYAIINSPEEAVIAVLLHAKSLGVM